MSDIGAHSSECAVLHSTSVVDVNGDAWEPSYTLKRPGDVFILEKSLDGWSVTQCDEGERREMEGYADQEVKVVDGFELAEQLGSLLALEEEDFESVDVDDLCSALEPIAPQWVSDFRSACRDRYED